MNNFIIKARYYSPFWATEKEIKRLEEKKISFPLKKNLSKAIQIWTSQAISSVN